jgi:hypothetical protein
MRQVGIGLSQGVVALFQGMVWGDAQPRVESVMARALFTHNHAYTTSDGRRVAVDYDPAKVEKHDWNAHTIPNPVNPYFGSIWLRNMRSKDDVPHILRAVPWLMRTVQDAPDDDVRTAARAALDHLRAFGQDIVDSGFKIRTMENGEVYTPTEDLASFVYWEGAIPNAECTAKLASALVGYGEARGIVCGAGIDPGFEEIATAGHYYNTAIIRYFHLAALTNALVNGADDAARDLMDGLVSRCDDMVEDTRERTRRSDWRSDMATYLVDAAESGLPLTGRDARIVVEQYTAAARHYAAWPRWDLWSAGVPDGEYDYIPGCDDGEGHCVVQPESLVNMVDYCRSPWKSASGAAFVDCDVVLDPSRWGM